MIRLGFGLTLGVLLVGLLAPIAPEAQLAARVPRIGWVSTSLVASPHLLEAFRQGLRDLGYVDGRDVVIEYRSAEGKLDRFPALVAELVRLKVDVIVAANTLAALSDSDMETFAPVVARLHGR